MAVCPRCGKYVNEDAIVCKSCGTTLKFEKWDIREALYYYGPLQRPIEKQRGVKSELTRLRSKKTLK